MDYGQFIRDSFSDELLLFDKYLQKSVESSNARISGVIKHIFNASGKRLRPILVFMSARACGGITPETYHGAATVELLHTASLVHDDVIDDTKLRRSQPSANAIFDNTRSVLVGDYLLSSALAESVKTKSLKIVEIMAELGRNLAEGELNQYALASDIVINEREYFDVIEKKTASLMRACTTIGAITAGAEEKTVSQFSRLGQILGIAFQIRDDIFDYYSDNVGKPTGNDIREGKITLPLIYALKHAPEENSKEMASIIHRRNYSEENIVALLDFAKNSGGIDYAYQKIDECISSAKHIINELACAEEIKSFMQMLLVYLKSRKL